MKEYFKIEHIDPLGQGVSRQGEKVTFIGKTLPEETGRAKILRQAKGVRFAFIESLSDIEKKSPDRITPVCPHFEQCSGCHFLHTHYSIELECKKSSFAHQLKYLEKMGATLPPIEVHPANRRVGYRNRIQLHYDRSLGRLGFIDPHHNTILEVPHCCISSPEVQEKLRELYKNHSWQKLVQDQSRNGHIEIFEKVDGTVQLAVNQPYSHGGFLQVNIEENCKLIDKITECASSFAQDATIVDLFGGKGNLSAPLGPRPSKVIDSSNYSSSDMLPHQEYHRLNLFAPNAIEQLNQIIPPTIDLLLVDPPRSGFKELSQLLEKVHAKHLFYVSCNLSSQIRDLAPLLPNYQLKQIHLFDFFPGTFHFESLILLQKKS